MATLGGILEAVLQVLGITQAINTLVQNISAFFSQSDPNSWSNVVLKNTSVTESLVVDPLVGLGTLKTTLNIINDNIAALQTSVDAGFANDAATLAVIETLVGQRQLGGVPVTLPTTPPAGYGGSSPSAIWAYVEPGSARTMGYWMVNAGVYGNTSGGVALTEKRVRFPGGWYVQYDWATESEPAPDVSFPPHFDPSTILSTDATLAAWLTRVYGAWGGTFDTAGYPQLAQPSGDITWRYWMSEVEFAQYKAAKFGSVAVVAGLPPIWPGIANVTLGDSVALEGEPNLNTPMHGVIIELDTVPPGRAQYVFGSQVSHGHLGALAFQDDDFEMEPPQNLGFDFEVYCPKSMAIAHGVKWRVLGGVTGLLTPWTINP